jgi:hypothetical protein
MGPWSDQLNELLLANEGKSPRERLTLIRLFEELRGRGYNGGYDTVRRYARRWSKERGHSTAAAFVPPTRTIPYKMKQGINSRRALLSRAGNLLRLAVARRESQLSSSRRWAWLNSKLQF